MNKELNQLLEKIKRNEFQKEEAAPFEQTQFEHLVTETRKELLARHKEAEATVPTVKQLFASVKFHDLIKYLETYTDMDEDTYQQYKEIFERVKKKETTHGDAFMLVDTEGEGAPDVCSIEYDKGIHYSFSLVPYAQLANYKIHPLTWNIYSKEEISAAILEEFSWATDDEYKEETKEEVESLKEEAEKYVAIDKAEEEGVLSIFGKKEEENPFKLMKRKEAVIAEDETIRHYAQMVSFEKVKRVLEEHCDDFEDILKLSKEEVVRLVEKQFFIVRKTINQTPKAPKGCDLFFNHLQNFLEVKKQGERIKGLYSGKCVYELIDEVVNRQHFLSTYTKEEVYAYFLIALLREELTSPDVNKENYQRAVQMVKKSQETKKIIEKAKKSIQGLTLEELLVFSRVIESIEMDY